MFRYKGCDYMAFCGNRLRTVRMTKGISQKELGEQVGHGRSAVCSWEKGKNRPSDVTLVKLCLLLGVSSDYLLEITNDQHPNINKELPDEIKNLKLKDIPLGKHLAMDELSLQEILDLITFAVMHHEQSTNFKLK